jgi:hypothetical protein
MTLIFEVPGVRPHDISVGLVIEPHTRVKQLVVVGRSSSPWPEVVPEGMVVSRERKFGAFRRGVNIPSNTVVSWSSSSFPRSASCVPSAPPPSIAPRCHGPPARRRAYSSPPNPSRCATRSDAIRCRDPCLNVRPQDLKLQGTKILCDTQILLSASNLSSEPRTVVLTSQSIAQFALTAHALPPRSQACSTKRFLSYPQAPCPCCVVVMNGPL